VHYSSNSNWLTKEGAVKDYFTEILYALALSKRTQVALVLGIVFFVGISLVGEFYASRLHFSGPLAGLEQAVIPKLMKRYDKVALIALISFWVVAFKCYRRDKRRFL
jgi:hypothetical protein